MWIKIVLVLNIAIEGLVGLIFIIKPSLVPLFAQSESQTIYVLRMYGFVALAICFLSFQMIVKFHEQELLVTGLLTLALFHAGVGLAQAMHVSQINEALPALILHVVLALVFFAFYWIEG